MEEKENQEDESEAEESTAQEETKSQKLLERAFRWPRLGVAERLVTECLVLATISSDTNVIVTHISKAAGMVEALNQPVENLDFKLLKRIFRLNKAFTNVQVSRINVSGTRKYVVPWPFDPSPENYEKYVEPWVVPANFFLDFIKFNRKPAIRIFHEPFLGDCCHTLTIVDQKEDESEEEEKKRGQEILDWLLKKYERCPKCERAIRSKQDLNARETSVVDFAAPKWSLFFESTTCLAEDGFQALRGAFESWAVDICMKAATVMSGLVSPATYEQIVKLIGKGKPEKREDKRDANLLET